MADIKLIVKIDADVYTRLFDNGIQDNEIATDDICEMARALRRGKPLPKGHGALKDADEVMNLMERNFDMQELYLPIHFMQFAMDEAQTIIEADKEDAKDADSN